ncbi:hypothetical protein IAI10_07970 [Clostridium sp. 19966]|uniref:CD1247 N-terminal domain-containing protein n=1 Tax=Clostridium sp. 19966 TaxID=2768166 RepID=UPI0028DF8605|nr:CD1247 N-terminal domain-containing protein [Clostridium sp. 19966]MDT8716590.1 hypothetical protein [Clostridium sp. 19966]
MESIKSKMTYIQGMIEGLELDSQSKEGKVICEIVKALELISDKISDIEETQLNLQLYLEAIDDNMQDIDESYDECSEYEDEFDEDSFTEIQCLDCGEKIYVDKSIIDNHENIKCPNCSGDIIKNYFKNINQ